MAWNSLTDFIRDPTSSTDCLGVYLKRTCSRVTSASSALGVLNDYALYKSTHALTHSLTHVQYRGISIPRYRARATPVRLIVRCLLQGLLKGSSVCRGMTAVRPSLSPGGGAVVAHFHHIRPLDRTRPSFPWNVGFLLPSRQGCKIGF